MLLSSRKQLQVVLRPDGIRVMLVQKGFRKNTILSDDSIAVIPNSALDWHSAIHALEQWLASSEIGKAEVKIYLSNSFLRFAMLPFSDEVHSDAERYTVAGLLFESIYGDTAKHWKLSLDDECYGEPSMAVAMDSELWDALQQIHSQKLQLISVQPQLSSAFNAFREKIKSSDGLFVVMEHEQLTLIMIKEQKIIGVRKTAFEVGSDGVGMVGLLQRELLMSGLSVDSAKIYLQAPASLNLTIPSGGGLDIVVLRREDLAQSGDVSCMDGVL